MKSISEERDQPTCVLKVDPTTQFIHIKVLAS